MTAELQRRGLPLAATASCVICAKPSCFVVAAGHLSPPPTQHHDLQSVSQSGARLKLTAVDQLWVADITYIQLPREFAYLAVLLDAFSRRVIGWALERHMMTELPLNALKLALATRPVNPSLIHHSDRGKQYAAAAYVSLLVKHQIRISMSRTGNPYDKPKAERFMRTVKYEEVYLSDYQTLTEARASIRHFIEEVYNRKRLHSALGYRPPVEFEQLLPQPITCLTICLISSVHYSQRPKAQGLRPTDCY